MRKNRTKFHKCLIGLINDQDLDGGVLGLSRESGIPYDTLQIRIRKPTSIKMFEFFNISDTLHLNGEQENKLLESIKEG